MRRYLNFISKYRDGVVLNIKGFFPRHFRIMLIDKVTKTVLDLLAIRCATLQHFVLIKGPLMLALENSKPLPLKLIKRLPVQSLTLSLKLIKRLPVQSLTLRMG